LLPPLEADNAEESVPKPESDSPSIKNANVSRLNFTTKPITERVLTIVFVLAVFTGYLLASVTYSNIGAIITSLEDNPIVVSHGLRVNEASVVKVSAVIEEFIFDYFYGSSP